jgi:hypothetical protein
LQLLHPNVVLGRGQASLKLLCAVTCTGGHGACGSGATLSQRSFVCFRRCSIGGARHTCALYSHLSPLKHLQALYAVCRSIHEQNSPLIILLQATIGC